MGVYTEELSAFVQDADGVLVVNYPAGTWTGSGGATNGDNNQVKSFRYCGDFSLGTYYVTLNDAYGDGWDGGGNLDVFDLSGGIEVQLISGFTVAELRWATMSPEAAVGRQVLTYHRRTRAR